MFYIFINCLSSTLVLCPKHKSFNILVELSLRDNFDIKVYFRIIKNLNSHDVINNDPIVLYI